jgi:hypothetical protein
MRRNYRALYPAGLISIVLLPLFCIWNLDKQHAFDKMGAIDVAYYYNYHGFDTAFKNWDKKVQSYRKYTKIEFTGIAKDDSLRLQYAHLEIKRILNSKDIINGLHIKFTENAKFWNFAEAMEIIQIENPNTLLNNNDLWMFYMPPVMDKSMEIQGGLCCCIQIEPKTISSMESIEAKIDTLTSLPKIYLLPLLFFILMWYFSLKRILSFHRFARTSEICTL